METLPIVEIDAQQRERALLVIHAALTLGSHRCFGERLANAVAAFETPIARADAFLARAGRRHEIQAVITQRNAARGTEAHSAPALRAVFAGVARRAGSLTHTRRLQPA